MKVDIIGCYVDRVDMEEALERIRSFIKENTPHQIITLNAEIAYRALNDPHLKDTINSAHLVTPDGIGIVLASRILGTPLKERVTGVDLTERIAREAAEKGWSIFLYGAAPGVAQEAAENLKRRYPGLKIAGISHGYRKGEEMDDLVEEIREKAPQVLLVALGAPRQEFWIRENLSRLNVPVCMGVGGTFDVLSGRVKRAPAPVQKAGLEWAYRILTDPKRIKRFLALPKFAVRVFLYRLKK